MKCGGISREAGRPGKRTQSGSGAEKPVAGPGQCQCAWREDSECRGNGSVF